MARRRHGPSRRPPEALGQELGAENFLGLAFDLADSTARSDAIVTLIESFANIDLLANHAGLALAACRAYGIESENLPA